MLKITANGITKEHQIKFSWLHDEKYVLKNKSIPQMCSTIPFKQLHNAFYMLKILSEI